jgi:hypothetical protein
MQRRGAIEMPWVAEPVKEAAEMSLRWDAVVQLSIDAQELLALAAERLGTPTGVIEVTEELSDEAVQELRDRFAEAHARGETRILQRDEITVNESAAGDAVEVPVPDTGTLKLAIDLMTIRERLIDICQLHKATLERSKIDKIKENFKFIEMTDVGERQALVEKAVGHPVVQLADLTPEEAEDVITEIRSREEPF